MNKVHIKYEGDKDTLCGKVGIVTKHKDHTLSDGLISMGQCSCGASLCKNCQKKAAKENNISISYYVYVNPLG